MSLPTFRLSSGQAVKPGKHPARHDPRTLQLSKDPPAGAIAQPPTRDDFEKKVAKWPRMLNDNLGDCQHMLCRFAALALLLATLPLFGDVTVRYNSEFKMGSFLPPGTGDQVPKALRDMNGPMVIRIKDDKAYSSFGRFISISDLVTNEVTYIDRENMRFATTTAEEVANAMAKTMQQRPPLAQNLAGMIKTDIKSGKTGRTEVIQGIRAEEYEVVMNLSMNIPMPNVPSGGPAMRMVTQIWRANADDVARNPALSEFTRYSTRAESFANVAQILLKLSGPLPHLGPDLSALQEEMGKDRSPMLRTHMEAQLLGRGQALPAGIDPAAPLVSMNQEIVEFSTDPIEDSIFAVPTGYRKVELEELLKDQIATAAGAPVQ